MMRLPTIDLVRNRRCAANYGRRVGRGLSYDKWLARCCDLMRYHGSSPWAVSFDWPAAYRRHLCVCEAVHEAMGGDEEWEIFEIPLRHSLSITDALVGETVA